jgi:16S rRNA (cytidine1402-2'-O)-methyltransferase
VGDRYVFLGFLPRRAGEREALWAELAAWPWPAVAFESPQRLGAVLASLASSAPERQVAVCRELTKRHEEVVRGSAAEVAGRFADAARGEITVVIGPAEPARRDESRVGAAVAAVTDLVAAGASRRVAADVVSRLTDVSRNDLYRASL